MIHHILDLISLIVSTVSGWIGGLVSLLRYRSKRKRIEAFFEVLVVPAPPPEPIEVCVKVHVDNIIPSTTMNEEVKITVIVETFESLRARFYDAFKNNFGKRRPADADESGLNSFGHQQLKLIKECPNYNRLKGIAQNNSYQLKTNFPEFRWMLQGKALYINHHSTSIGGGPITWYYEDGKNLTWTKGIKKEEWDEYR